MELAQKHAGLPMTHVVLVHGWGYDARLWDALCPHLPDDWTLERLDFGFYGEPPSGALAQSIAVSPAPTWGKPVIAVGHSLGALWWLSQAPGAWSRLLCLNGFPRFCQQADYTPAVPARSLARMRQRLRKQPAQVLAEFARRVGVATPERAPDVRRLDAGLAALEEWDGRTTLQERAGDVFALYSADDAIVPAAMSAMAFAALPPAQHAAGAVAGHALPVSAPALCAQWLQRLAT